MRCHWAKLDLRSGRREVDTGGVPGREGKVHWVRGSAAAHLPPRGLEDLAVAPGGVPDFVGEGLRTRNPASRAPLPLSHSSSAFPLTGQSRGGLEMSSPGAYAPRLQFGVPCPWVLT